MWGLRASQKSALLKCISETFVDYLWCDNYLRHCKVFSYEVLLLTVLLGTALDILTSNQARLPAELKHINKRRKRN
jgi:hypothetical protein